MKSSFPKNPPSSDGNPHFGSIANAESQERVKVPENVTEAGGSSGVGDTEVGSDIGHSHEYNPHQGSPDSPACEGCG